MRCAQAEQEREATERAAKSDADDALGERVRRWPHRQRCCYLYRRILSRARLFVQLKQWELKNGVQKSLRAMLSRCEQDLHSFFLSHGLFLRVVVLAPLSHTYTL